MDRKQNVSEIVNTTFISGNFTLFSFASFEMHHDTMSNKRVISHVLIRSDVICRFLFQLIPKDPFPYALSFSSYFSNRF